MIFAYWNLSYISNRKFLRCCNFCFITKTKLSVCIITPSIYVTLICKSHTESVACGYWNKFFSYSKVNIYSCEDMWFTVSSCYTKLPAVIITSCPYNAILIKKKCMIISCFSINVNLWCCKCRYRFITCICVACTKLSVCVNTESPYTAVVTYSYCMVCSCLYFWLEVIISILRKNYNLSKWCLIQAFAFCYFDICNSFFKCLNTLSVFRNWQNSVIDYHSVILNIIFEVIISICTYFSGINVECLKWCL